MIRTVMKRLVAVPLAVVAGAGLVAPAAAHAAVKTDTEIVLPGATSAEGIARGEGSTFYAGDLFTGDIFRGDVKKGTAELFIDAPQGRQAGGMKVSLKHHLLFVAGGFTGHGYVYDTETGASVADYAFSSANTSLINDVALVPGGAWFTDTFQPKLYFVPIDAYGDLGPFTTLTVTGGAGELSGQFNLNGIAATPDGKTLIVAHTTNASLYTVDQTTGASTRITGVDVPNVDGILLRGHRMWVVQNFSNQISRFTLSADFSSGTLEKVITSSLFEVPTTTALFGDTLATVNGKFDTGFPPTATQYEVVLTGA